MSVLREKLPELLLEALSVVFAVLVALGVDEWRDNREKEELAGRALDAIVSEIESNRAELMDARPGNDSALERVRSASRMDTLPTEFDLNYEYSLLSSSGWETARVTQATHYIPLETVQRITKLYALQGLFEDSQDKVFALVLQAGQIASESPERIPDMMLAPLANAMNMEHVLVEAYDSILPALGAGGG